MTAPLRYEIVKDTDQFTIYELTDRDTDSRVRVCPERGGIVIGCRLNGEELLYLDKDTFYDPQANIRGGIPVLFPICGQLREGQYEWEGQTFQMKNHGVTRTNPWQVADTSAVDSAAITLVLRSSPDTLASYPFDFELRFTYRLKDGTLSIEQEYRNLSDRPMPMVAGFHPYFATEDKNLPYVSDATRMLDYNDGATKPFEGTVALEGLKESVALLDASRPEIAFPISLHTMVRLTYSELFKIVVLWSVEGKPFVCVEPWTALNEALNDKKGLQVIEPGDTLQANFQIASENVGLHPDALRMGI